MTIGTVRKEKDMQGDAMSRTRGTTALAIFAAIGGVIGLLAGLWLVGVALGNGSWPLVTLLVALVVLVVSVAELAFAYSAWTQTGWALKPGPRAVGFALAIALNLLGVLFLLAVLLLTPQRSTFEPTRSPITRAQ